VEFDYSPFGITGLETELSLSLMQLHHSNMLGLPELLAKYTVNPARLLKIKKGTLESGSDADVTVIDADEEWTYDATSDASQSANSPFNGWRLRGRAMLTVVAGEIVWRAEAIAA
jgi:dihydroorotase